LGGLRGCGGRGGTQEAASSSAHVASMGKRCRFIIELFIPGNRAVVPDDANPVPILTAFALTLALWKNRTAWKIATFIRTKQE
jgi:hypothetical protein